MASTGGASGAAGQRNSYDFDASDDVLTAEFRHRIGILPEEQQTLSEAFTSRIGLVGGAQRGGCADEILDETMRELSEISLPGSRDVEREATLTKTKFEKFAKSFFQTKSCLAHAKLPLTEPLLAKKHEFDRTVSLLVSVAIKRFCGDVPMPQPSDINKQDACTPVITSVVTLLNTLYQNEISTTASTDSDQTSKRHSTKKVVNRSKSNQESESSRDSSELVSKVPSSDFQLAQFVVAVGVMRRELRDEIYCQLCAQVTKNSTSDSCLKGWQLHALCAGCFMPSHDLLKYYFGFLNDSAVEWRESSTQVRRALHRTSEMGRRYHPPNWIEFQAVRARKTVMLPVQLADHRKVAVEADSSLTAAEVCRHIATDIGLRDQFGFAIYISIYDKVSSLGQGPDHVMDAISECEMVVRSEGGREEDAPWQLHYRKEMFTPWHDVELDAVATDLIYRQIIQAVHANEYRLRSEDEVARFLARRWFVDHGENIIPGQLHTSLGDMLPQELIGTVAKSRDSWTQAVIAAFDHMGLSSNKYSKTKVKYSIVESGKRKWPLHFAGLFEASCVSGLNLGKDDVVLAISCRGVFLLDEPYRVLVGLRYYELVDAIFVRNAKDRNPGFTLITIRGEQWTLTSTNADTITKLLSTFLDGLRRRSRWAIAIQDFIVQDHTKSTSTSTAADTFRLRHGDVVELLDELQQNALKEDWMYGRCERTGLCGGFPYDSIYILPTCEKPPAEFMSMFVAMSRSYVDTLPRKRGVVVLTKQTIGRYTGHGKQSSA